ncbi:MAG: hypothetical protein KatS3mg004_2628 [Bryobacteraceae bacterium]|nr:MAG: hypothetical protein KatS3mg004_2628 [Bryobacteraceae bacterium]
MRIAAATIISNRRIALARATARSLEQHHPDLPFFTLQADGPHPAIDPAREPFRLVPLSSLGLAREAALRFRYTDAELSFACTPHFICHLLEQGFDAVLFLKQETMVVGRLDPLLDRLAHHPVLLTPHLLAPPLGPGARRREWNVLRAGVFNGGVLGFSRCPEAQGVLTWWRERTEQHCVLDVDDGLHFEQRWLDFIPSLAPGCLIVRDPGINVGHWNLPERRIEVRGGLITACGLPCRIFRFSGYDPERPDVLSRYAPSMTAASIGPAAELLRRYHALLEACGWRDTWHLPYAWDRFDNGTPIRPQARRIFRLLGPESARFGDPFRTGGPDTFYAWLRTRHPGLMEGGADG